MTNTTPIEPGFYGLGIAPKLLEILEQNKFRVPTPIQKQSIPVALEGKDVMGIAQTGTGKTLAFGIPMIQRLAQGNGTGLIILPTRELAIQVDETIQKIGRGIGLRTVVLIGGASMHYQIQGLRKSPHIIIGTPGRINDHIEQRTVDLRRVKVLVLDEADRMLDMGFEPQIKRILQQVPKERQTLLFSATMPRAIVHIAESYMQLPVRVEIAQAGTAADRVTQEIIFVRKEDKTRLLQKILTEHKGTTLVFSRTKHGAKKIARSVRAMGHTSSDIHSDRSLSQRREALEGFKSGKYRVLVATDIAARGIDVRGIEVVINFDLPDNSEDYVHRIGRTGRAGQSGHAISFATPDQRRDVKDIERLMRIALPVRQLPELPPAMAPLPMEQERPGRSYGRSSSGSGRSSNGSGRSYGGSSSRSSSGSGYSRRPSTAPTFNDDRAFEGGSGRPQGGRSSYGSRPRSAGTGSSGSGSRPVRRSAGRFSRSR